MSQPVTVRQGLGSRYEVVQFLTSQNNDFFNIYEYCQPVAPKEKELRYSNLELYKTDFTIDFYPYDCIIIDTIEQFFLPSILNASDYDKVARSKYFAVKAKIGTINIRSSFAINKSCVEKDSILNKDQFEYLYVRLDMYIQI